MSHGSVQLVFAICALTSLQLVGGQQLIRPRYVYERLIKDVHDYFNNTCIILLHATPNPIERQGLEHSDDLLALQLYLSAKLNIRTAIMDLQMFRKRVGKSYYRIKRPLFVILNDRENVRKEFVRVSNGIDVAYPTWLVFVGDGPNFGGFFADVYVPFNSKLLVSQSDRRTNGERIREVYRIHRRDELRSGEFGSWNESGGLLAPTLGLYRRRNDLHGYNIRVACVHDPPVSVIRRNDRDEVIGLGGFFGDVIELLQEGMNSTFTYAEADSWGVRTVDGTWKGSIGMLIDGRADVAAIELIMTSDRLDAVQFTTPVYTTKCRSYIKRPATAAIKWDAYTAPFAPTIWNSIGILVVVSGGMIVFIRTTVGRLRNPRLADYEDSPSRFTEILFHVFGAFCGQGMQPSQLDAIRVVQLIVHLTGVVVLAAYSAALISFLAMKTFVMPFTTMEGLLKDGTYRFAVVADSADYTFFRNTTDSVLSVMFNELLTRESDLPMNYLDGLRRVCKEDKYSFMTMDNMALVLQEMVDCTLEPLDAMTQATVAMAVSPGSPYRGIIDSNILLLRDSGILQRLLKSQWTVETRRKHSQGWSSVGLEDVLPLLLFVLLAVLVTSLMLVAERVLHRKILTARLAERKIAAGRSRSNSQ